MKEKVQDDKILLRLSTSLTAAMDQVLKEQLQGHNRSEFIRRAIRYTLDHIEDYKASEASTVDEKQSVESVEKINNVRDLYDQLYKYTDALQKEASTPIQFKQIAFLIRLIGMMVFRMND
jgi:metal-responsive CopG/Arc/MetJ family transcriptional regulator